MSIVTAIVGHLMLYALWWLPAQRERAIRTDGRLIPFYFSGSIGDAVGFSLTSITFLSVAPEVSIGGYALSIFVALSITYVLHEHWSRVAKLSAVSLYDRTGIATIAGKIHFAYVVGIIVSLSTVVLTWHSVSTQAQVYFILGLFVYVFAVFIDKLRGVV